VPFSSAQIEEAVSLFAEYLRRKRLKMTAQRRSMVRTVMAERGHFTAEELHHKLLAEGEAVSLATVYRGLSLLEEAELLEGHDFADGTRRYERSLDREHHDHMVCMDCRAVIEFTNERIERQQEKVADTHGFTIADHSLTLFVRCNAWREQGTCERRRRHEARQRAARR
jgi:Fur family ferric uptake transcriptional regulator